jgi:hypothetical protein
LRVQANRLWPTPTVRSSTPDEQYQEEEEAPGRQTSPPRPPRPPLSPVSSSISFSPLWSRPSSCRRVAAVQQHSGKVSDDLGLGIYPGPLDLVLTAAIRRLIWTGTVRSEPSRAL